VDPGLVADFSTLFEAGKPQIEMPVLTLLNAGGSPQQVIDAFVREYEPAADQFYEMDFTGDGVPELLVNLPYLHIFGCDNGQYRIYLKMDPGGEISSLGVVAAQDMNLDGLPELVLEKSNFDTNLYQNPVYQIIEWDGRQFQNLVLQPDFTSRYGGGGAHAGWLGVEGLSGGSTSIWDNWEILDVDANGTLEFILRGGIPTHPAILTQGPWRAETDIYMWNGFGFVLYAVEPDPPKYRFQALQDAEYAFFDGNYDTALELYQQVIFNDNLDWWSEDRSLHEIENVMGGFDAQPTLTPLPVDPTEYYHLAGYSRYRIMLMHVVRGWLPEAQTVYQGLQDQFPVGYEGHIFAELAASFWLDFQVTQDIGSACTKAIEYTVQNQCAVFNYIQPIGGCSLPEVSTYHGMQKERKYVVEDICPFK
jgi:hypothetical protein